MLAVVVAAALAVGCAAAADGPRPTAADTSNPEPTMSTDDVPSPEHDADDSTPASQTPSSPEATRPPGASSAPEEEDGPGGAELARLPREVDAGTPAGAYVMERGASSTITLPPGSVVEQEGDAVAVFPIASLDDTGAAMWEARAVALGTTTILATLDDASIRWDVTVHD